MMKFLIILVLLSHVIADISKEEFVKKVNELRRGLAKREKIPNMHELIWIDDIPKPLVHSFDIVSYEDQINTLEKILPQLKKGQDLPKGIDHSFLTPWLTDFWCTKVYEPNVTCYVDFNIVAFTQIFEKEGEPGSNCKKGFENHDGLCGLIQSTTLAPTTVEMTTTSSKSINNEEKVHPTTTNTMKTIPDEKEKKEEETENNSSSFNLFVVFVFILWIFIE